MTKWDVDGRPVEIVSLDDEDEWEGLYKVISRDSLAVTVEDIFQTCRQMGYEYDFGDGWQHTIRLRRFIDDCPESVPRCIQAIGDAPMENSGGPGGFAEIMAILKDLAHPQYEEIFDWVRHTWWTPLDVERINQRVRDTHRRPIPPRMEMW